MIIYVDSPFQLMQAYELVCEKNNIKRIYVRLNDQFENNNQLLNIIDFYDMTNVTVINISALYQKLYHYVKFTIIAFFIKEFVIGDSKSTLFKLLIIFHSNSKFILLDDGVSTINSPEENAVFKRFTIFSHYVNFPIINNFYHLKEKLKLNGELKHIIIGGKFISEGICSESTYHQALSRIVQNLTKTIPIIYVPHRGETNQQLDKLKKLFAIDIDRTKLPIELISAELNISPASLSHVLSTAVYSMRVIYGNLPIYTFQLNDELIISRRAGMINLYDQMKGEGISKFIR